MADQDRIRWDGRHADREASPVGPPEVFADYANEFPDTGYGLELACGQGAASVWLALRGVDMLGVDVSPVAIERARGSAGDYRVDVRCRFEVRDLDFGLPPGPQADVILCHKFRDRMIDAAVIERLVPGGLLAISALSEVGARPGPFRVFPGELPQAFSVLEPVASAEGDGQAWLLARKA